ncbi:hypothetical protein BRC89_12645 [Halobacteriales archaeon QS_4_70_19]|nr:MAG: hypothetical protein BRC89_12645 [Halobacteriales archaeon QS_4_70_19]
MAVTTDGGFVAFYRRYARTGVHAVATAALTAFGTLTVVHPVFALVALGAYSIPPVALYTHGSRADSGVLVTPDDGQQRRGSTTPGGGQRQRGSATLAEERPQGGSTTTAGATVAHGSQDDEAAPRSPASPADGPPTDQSSEDDQSGEETGRDEPVIAWSAARAPTDGALEDVVVTRETAIAVGEGGTVLERDEGREPWTVVLPGGPAGDGATLQGVDATADGDAVWTVGDGGAVGRRDAAGRWVDHSAPAGDTNSLVDVAVTTATGTETVLVTDGSGSIRRGRHGDGAVAWEEPTTPGSGSSIVGIVLAGETGYVVDTAGDAFRTTDAGASYTRLDLDSRGTPAALAVVEDGVAVATTAGVVHLHDGTRWTVERVADDLSGLTSGSQNRTVAVGGTSLHSRLGPNDWDSVVVPAAAPLRSVVVGDAGGVAVGAAGAIVERWRA